MNRRISICFLGGYDPLYPRNILVKKALKQTNIEIIECNDQSPGIKHYLKLIKKYMLEGRKADKIYVAVLGYYDVPLAWILAKIFRKDLIFDAFYSLYDTYIDDRKVAKPRTYKALRFYFYDWISVRLADKILLDTKENIDYFVKKYRANRRKFFELPVTADPDIFKISPHKKHKVFTVGFYGSFMPLHGVSTIVDAANILKNEKIKFCLLGIGPGASKIKRKIKNLGISNKVLFQNKKIAYSHLPRFLSKIDLFLAGPFGSTDKANRVLTAKTVEALSVGATLVVAKTPATSRLLHNYKGNNLLWLDENDPDKLAQIIRKVFSNNSKSSLRSDHQNHLTKIHLDFESFSTKLNTIINK